jgi:hypothetical protein
MDSKIISEANQQHSTTLDLSKLCPVEFLAAMMVGHQGCNYLGLQAPANRGDSHLVIFIPTPRLGCSLPGTCLSIPLLDLSTRSIRDKLLEAHIRFGLRCCETDDRAAKLLERSAANR